MGWYKGVTTIGSAGVEGRLIVIVIRIVWIIRIVSVIIVVIIVVEYLLFRPLETYVFSYRQDAELEMSVR